MIIYLAGAPDSEAGEKPYSTPNRLLSFYNILNSMWGDSYIFCYTVLQKAAMAAQEAAEARKAKDPSAAAKQELADKLARGVIRFSTPVTEGRELP